LPSNHSWASCVQVGQEHDGNSLKVRNAIMPMSASRWVAMNNGLTIKKIGSAILAGSSLVSKAGVPQPAVMMVGSEMVPNPDFYADDTWGRETWLVVDYDRITNRGTVQNPSVGYDPALALALNKTIETSLANIDDTDVGSAGYWKKKFGILPPESEFALRTLPTS